MESLGVLSKDYGSYKCCCAKFTHGEREWLYDMLWYEYDDNENLKRIPFVLECEWAYSEVGVNYDFEKLLVTKADFKVIITQRYGFE